MALIVLLSLALVWLMQTVFLEPVYKWGRKNEIRRIADTLAASPDDRSLRENAKTLALSHGVCVIVEEEGKLIVSAEGINNCAIHNIAKSGLSTLFFHAEANGGELMQSFVKDDYHDLYVTIDETRDESSLAGTESVIFTKIVRRGNAARVFYLNTIITPVSSTVSSMNLLLFAVSAAALLLALLAAFLFAGGISKPIETMSEKAKRLAGGDYDIDFVSGGGRELTELGRTLNQTEKELQKNESLRRELIANVSHDLRTPLTMISGYAEVMRDIPGENTPENMQIIIDETGRLSSLVADLLEISRLQSGTQKLDASPFCFTAAVRSVLDRIQHLIGQKGFRVLFEADREEYVCADEKKITQVVYNLVGNAVTHTGEDKTVVVRQTVAEGMVRLSVIDSGEGIPAEKLENIWDRYYKVDSVHKRAEVGSGLGLSIVKGIMELHGGRYGVITEQGKGSTFWFELSPVGQPEDPK